jgi:hypothetical protein
MIDVSGLSVSNATERTIAIDDADVEHDRLKIVFDDGEVMYFKIDESSIVSGYNQLVLDIDLTRQELVDEIILPKDRTSARSRYIFSHISEEVYKRLTFVCVNLNDGDRLHLPGVGEELFLWIYEVIGASAWGNCHEKHRRITEITSITLDP